MSKIALFLGATGLFVSSFAIEFITIGTGGVTGTYYPTGGAICRLANKMKKESGIRCSVESTGGSVYNVNAIGSGDLDFGMVQSDVAYQASRGEGKFEGKAIPKLRSVMAIYPELLALVVRKDANINSIEDLKGKKINVGNPGSGNEATAMVIFDEYGIKKNDLALWGVLTAQECPMALKDNKIEGYFYMVGHPTANITDAANSTPINIVPIEGKKADDIVSKYPYYAKGYIPANTYSGVNENVNSIGVKALLVTSSDVSDKSVETILKAVLDNFDEFKEMHPAYKSVTKESLLEGIAVPMHKGAEKYYKQIGLMK